METKPLRIYLVEFLGTFALVLFSAGLVCINHITTPEGQAAGVSPLNRHQPGAFGIALGQGLILAVMLALTVSVSGGYLNPAITLMLWVFNRVDTRRAVWLIGAQILGSFLAALCLRFTFDPALLRIAQFGAPHVNDLVYQPVAQPTYLTGTLLELLLTFFLVIAIFGMAGKDTLTLGVVTGMTMTVCALFGYPLTGAALNPARWIGPTVLESFSIVNPLRSPWADTLVYLAGPIAGALLGGGFVFYVYQPAEERKK